MSKRNAWTLLERTGWRPHVIAHRGASGYAPENTVSAYQKAVELGVVAVETDVHQTQDGEIVTIHDATLDRTTSGTGDVASYDWEEVRALDAGSWYDSSFSQDFVPNLDMFLECLGEQVIPVIELKGGKTVVEQLARKFAGSVGGAFFFSFKAKMAEELKRLCDGCPVLYLAEWTEEEIPCAHSEIDLAEKMGMDAIGVHWPRLSPAFVVKAHQVGLGVFVYTVNDEAALVHCLKCDVDAVISDYPDRIENWLDQRKS